MKPYDLEESGSPNLPPNRKAFSSKSILLLSKACSHQLSNPRTYTGLRGPVLGHIPVQCHGQGAPPHQVQVGGSCARTFSAAKATNPIDIPTQRTLSNPLLPKQGRLPKHSYLNWASCNQTAWFSGSSRVGNEEQLEHSTPNAAQLEALKETQTP